MKNFSKKNLTKACAFMLGGALCFAVAGAVSVNEASASSTLLTPDQITAATTKIEDMIDSTADLDVYRADAGGSSTKNGTDSTLTWDGGSVKIGRQMIYNSTVSTADEHNVLDYDGNLALWNDTTQHTNYASKTVLYVGFGYRLLGDTAYAQQLNAADTENGTAGEGYGLVRFRTRYDETRGQLNLGMMSTAAESGSIESTSANRGGYTFVLNKAKTITLNKYTEANKRKNITDPSPSYSVVPNEGDLLDITYGVLKDGDNNVLYLNIEKLNDDGSTTTLIKYDYTDTSMPWCNDSGKTFFIGMQSSFSRASADVAWTGDFYDGVLLAGVEKPIFEENLAWTETTAITAGTKLSDVALSKKGYTWADGNATVAIGENTCTATLTDYYGQTTDVTATVTLTGTPDFAAATTNIEALVNSYEDFNVIQGNSGGCNSGETRDWNGDGAREGNMWAHYASKKDSKYQDASPYLDYDGNLAVWTRDESYSYSSSTTTGYWWGIGFNLKNQTEYGKTNGDGYGIVRFRTKWDSTWTALELGVLVRTNSGYVSYDSPSRGGYVFKLQQNSVVWSEDRINGTSGKYTPITSAVPTYNVAPAEGDVLDISYGVLKNGDTHILYLNIDKWVEGATELTNICNFVYTDSDLTDNFYNASGKCFAIKPMGFVNRDNPLNDGFLLAGVNEPILTDVAAEAKGLDGIEADETDGTLSTVALDDGYAWKNGAIALEKGEYEYDATYTYNYYGNSKTVDVKVGVTVTGTRTTLQLKDGDTVLKSVELKTGETFTLNSATLTGVGTVIGWTAAGSTDLLKPDTVFTATATENTTVVYNVVDIDFKLLDGASIRTVKNEAGNGGIRFVAMFNSDDWAANAAYIQSVYGVIVPTDDATYFNGGFTAAAKTLYTVAENNFVGKDSLSYADVNLTEAQAGGYALYTFAMTDVKYENYNRDFAAMSFITVKYANGDTLDFETAYNEDKNCRSVYEVAVAAIADHKEKGDTVYNNAQLAVLESYIANVVDLAYDEATSSFSVVDREQHGFTRPYGEVVSGTVGQNGEVTVVLTTAEDSILATNDYAPVFVTADGETIRFEATVTYANGQVTLTFVTAE